MPNTQGDKRSPYLLLGGKDRSSEVSPERSKLMNSFHQGIRCLLDLMSAPRLELNLLQGAMERLSKLLGTRYAALALLDENGLTTEFLFAGITPEQAQQIGIWPLGKGLLGPALFEKGILHVSPISEHRQFSGFPPGHPPMQTLLAATVGYNNQIFGRIYLCNKLNGEAFSGEDEAMLSTFADALALAVFATREQERKQQVEQQALIASTVFEKSAEGILITDAEQKILTVNQALSTITGYAREEVIGLTPKLFSSGRHGKKFYSDMWRLLAETGQWQGEIWNRRKNGAIYPEWLSISRLADAKGKVTHYVAVFSDLTAQRLGDERLDQLLHYDHLTELPNRMMFREHLKKAILRAHFNGTLTGLLLFDIDRFKTINDTFGHQVGDQLLQQIAERLRACLRDEQTSRKGDIIARLSGDEFTIILNDLVSPECATTVAQRVLDAFNGPFLLGDRERQITVSIGIALCPRDAENIDDLIRNADLAMYYAKHQGRNNYQFYAPRVQQDNNARLKLENDLYGALERGEFLLYYQPQWELASHRIIGLETLLRWHHPVHGLIMPDQFVPLLEETGLIVSVGEWMMEQACRQALVFQSQTQVTVPISVNLSGCQFREGLAEIVGQALYRSGLAPSNLRLELTETVAMHDVKATINMLEDLASMGVGVYIDDFGTGYSSLSYLQKFRIAAIKIDKSFIIGNYQDPSHHSIVRAIIDLAHNLGLPVIAEGIETPEQLRYLIDNRCEMGQGFLFSPPLPAEGVLPLLIKQEH